MAAWGYYAQGMVCVIYNIRTYNIERERGEGRGREDIGWRRRGIKRRKGEWADGVGQGDEIGEEQAHHGVKD